MTASAAGPLAAMARAAGVSRRRCSGSRASSDTARIRSWHGQDRGAGVRARVFKDQWDALVRELEEEGHDVAFDQRFEERGGQLELPPGVERGTLVIIELYIGKKLAGEALDNVLKRVVDAVLGNLRGRGRGNPRRSVVSVDEHGRPLKSVVVPKDDAT